MKVLNEYNESLLKQAKNMPIDHVERALKESELAECITKLTMVVGILEKALRTIVNDSMAAGFRDVGTFFARVSRDVETVLSAEVNKVDNNSQSEGIDSKVE